MGGFSLNYKLCSCILYFYAGATTHCVFVFYSLLAGYSLLAYEVSWSHTTTRRSR